MGHRGLVVRVLFYSAMGMAGEGMSWLFERHDKARIEAIDRGDVRVAARISKDARKPTFMMGDAIVDPSMDMAMYPKIGPPYEIG